MTERYRIDDTVRDDDGDVVDGTEVLGFFETGGVPGMVEDADVDQLVDPIPSDELVGTDTVTLLGKGVIGNKDVRALSELDY